MSRVVFITKLPAEAEYQDDDHAVLHVSGGLIVFSRAGNFWSAVADSQLTLDNLRDFGVKRSMPQAILNTELRNSFDRIEFSGSVLALIPELVVAGQSGFTIALEDVTGSYDPVPKERTTKTRPTGSRPAR